MAMKKSLSLILALTAVMTLALPASAAQTDTLSSDTKRAYYEAYLEIAQDVSKETELDIEVIPMEEFEDADWRTPQEFRDVLLEVAHWNLICAVVEHTPAQVSAKSDAVSATKSTTVTADDHNYTLSITGKFKTQLNKATGRQHFAGVESITSKISGSTGTWTQTGYESESLDSARTFGITVSGTLKIAGATFKNKLAYAEFYCSDTGVVS